MSSSNVPQRRPARVPKRIFFSAKTAFSRRCKQTLNVNRSQALDFGASAITSSTLRWPRYPKAWIWLSSTSPRRAFDSRGPEPTRCRFSSWASTSVSWAAPRPGCAPEAAGSAWISSRRESCCWPSGVRTCTSCSWWRPAIEPPRPVVKDEKSTDSMMKGRLYLPVWASLLLK